MISLFIDTSSSDVCVSVLRDGVVLAEICKNIPGEHSIYTTSFLDEVIKKAGIEHDSVDKIMVVNVSGRGDKDVAAIARYKGEDIYE